MSLRTPSPWEKAARRKTGRIRGCFSVAYTGLSVRKKRTPVSIQNHQKRMSVFVKKCLTNGDSGGIICKLSGERLPNSPEDNKTLLKTSKNTKKVLDKFLRMC